VLRTGDRPGGLWLREIGEQQCSPYVVVFGSISGKDWWGVLGQPQFPISA
jgi:hypothetical protein